MHDDISESVPDRLVAAFRAAEYVVHADGGDCRIRIGRRHPVLDRRIGRRPWSIVTAHNPAGRRRAAAGNRGADRALERCLRALGPALIVRCTNRDPAGEWPDEPGWLYAPAEARAAARIGRRFGQAAIVTGRPGAPARLRFLLGNAPSPVQSDQRNA